MKRWYWGGGALLCLAGAAILLGRSMAGGAAPPASSAAGTSLPALPHPVQIEVLNASGISGKARTTTQLLREAGLDVVYYGTASSAGTGSSDSNRVLIRGGDTTGLGRILSVVGPAQVETVGPENRWVAFSVLLGKGTTNSEEEPQ